MTARSGGRETTTRKGASLEAPFHMPAGGGH